MPQIPAIQNIANKQDGFRFSRQLCTIPCIFRMVSYNGFVIELSNPVHFALAFGVEYCQHAWPKSLVVTNNLKFEFK